MVLTLQKVVIREQEMYGDGEGAFCVCEIVDSGMRNEVVLSELAGTQRSGFTCEPQVLSAKSQNVYRFQPFVHEALLGDGHIFLQLPLKGIHYGRRRRTQLYHHLQPAIQEQAHRCAHIFRAWQTIISTRESHPRHLTGEPHLFHQRHSGATGALRPWLHSEGFSTQQQWSNVTSIPISIILRTVDIKPDLFSLCQGS